MRKFFEIVHRLLLKMSSEMSGQRIDILYYNVCLSETESEKNRNVCRSSMLI